MLSGGGEVTYENTIAIAEELDEQYAGIAGEYRGLMDLVPSPEMRKQENGIAKLDADENEKELFNLGFAKRVRLLYRRWQRGGGRVGARQKLIRDYYRGFVLGGAYLPEAKKKALAKLERRLAGLELLYGKKIDRLPKYAFLSRRSELAGLGKDEIRAARSVAKKLGRSGWAMRLEPTLAQPPATRLWNPQAKKSLIEAARKRGRGLEQCAVSIAQTRLEMARLLGFRSWSHLKFFENESGSPSKVWGVFQRSMPAVDRLLQEDVDRAKEAGWTGWEDKAPLWSFFPEKDENGRFSPQRVLEKGCFWVGQKMFGLQFLLIKGAETYHPEVNTYLVKRRGKTLGFLLVDFWQRPDKGDGAWAITWDSRRTKERFPCVSICCNFSPERGCDMEGVVTIFHEFGHALHALFTSHLTPSHAGLECANDFVEIPSQVAEHWAYDKAVYKRYSDRTSPKYEQIAKGVEGGTGAVYLASLISAGADLIWHGEGVAKIKEAKTADEESASRIAPRIAGAEPRYKSPYFEHIFNSGYDASYYSYLWCELQSGQIQSWVEGNGGLSPKTGSILFKHIYGVGGDRDTQTKTPWQKHPSRLFFEFRGSPLPRAQKRRPSGSSGLPSRGARKGATQACRSA